MYIKRSISPRIIFKYSWRRTIIYTLFACLVFSAYYYLEWHFVQIPFEPISVIGIAVAFLIGFKNSESYDRFWEGRKIWGGIVNYSRTWAIQVLNFVKTADKEETKKLQQQMIYRHLGWINALRVQLRQPRPWAIKENKLVSRLHNRHGERNISCDEAHRWVDEDEYQDLKKRVNSATHLVKNQAAQVTSLRDRGILDGFREDQLQSVLEELYNLQGRCERIKNTPFPRQYGYFSLLFTNIFIFLIPFGLLDVFERDLVGSTDWLRGWYIFLMIPFSVLISWVFSTMDSIGDNSEDPFEGRFNDVPMTALCRTIEIDLRDMLDEEELPENIQPKDNILY
jgi:putative membrane protein